MKWHNGIIIFAAAGLAACASIATEIPEISLPELRSEQAAQEASAFAHMEELETRLGHVAAQVLSANAPLCQKTRYGLGAKTHSLKSYPKSMREAAARDLGAGSLPVVRFVRAGSPAQRAGLLPGDEILSRTGVPITAKNKGLQARLKESALRGAAAPLKIRRNGLLKAVNVTPEKHCAYDVRLRMSSNVNAYATGSAIIVTSGMMDFAKTDAELALIVSHELAHNTMGHISKIVTNSILSVMSTRFTRPFESEADYVGMYYLVRAGYSPDGVEDVWKRMSLINPRAVGRAKSHPTYPDRYLRLAAAREEIKNKLKSSAPLVPNFKSKDKAS